MTLASAQIEFWGRVVMLAAVGHYVLVTALAPRIWPSLLLLAGALVWTTGSRVLRHRGAIVEIVLLYWGAVLVANLLDSLKNISAATP